MSDPLSSRELAAFAAAVETGSVQGAAEALDLTQSATTKRIQALERRLGVSLLHRGRHGVRATEEGMALYPEARRGLDALALAEQAVADSHAARPLRIAASHTIGEALLPTWLTAFRAELPGVHPQVDVVNSTGVLAAIRDGVPMSASSRASIRWTSSMPRSSPATRSSSLSPPAIAGHTGGRSTRKSWRAAVGSPARPARGCGQSPPRRWPSTAWSCGPTSRWRASKG